jgi:hypothetical protein
LTQVHLPPKGNEQQGRVSKFAHEDAKEGLVGRNTQPLKQVRQKSAAIILLYSMLAQQQAAAKKDMLQYGEAKRRDGELPANEKGYGK